MNGMKPARRARRAWLAMAIAAVALAGAGALLWALPRLALRQPLPERVGMRIDEAAWMDECKAITREPYYYYEDDKLMFNVRIQGPEDRERRRIAGAEMARLFGVNPEDKVEECSVSHMVFSEYPDPDKYPVHSTDFYIIEWLTTYESMLEDWSRSYVAYVEYEDVLLLKKEEDMYSPSVLTNEDAACFQVDDQDDVEAFVALVEQTLDARAVDAGDAALLARMAEDMQKRKFPLPLTAMERLYEIGDAFLSNAGYTVIEWDPSVVCDVGDRTIRLNTKEAGWIELHMPRSWQTPDRARFLGWWL